MMTRPPDVLDEYTALLQRLHDTRRELDEERQRRESAEDRAWGAVVDELAGAGLHEPLERICQAHGIERRSVTGQRVEEISLIEFAVLTTLPAPTPDERGRIAETVRPAIHRNGRLVRPGLIVVLQDPAVPNPAPRSEPS